MRRFKHILVLAAETATAAVLDRAVDLARRNRAAVTLLDVQEAVPSRLRRRRSADGSLVDLDAVMAAARLDEMSRLARLHATVEVDVVVTRSPVFVEVVRRVVRDGHDLVVVAAGPDDSTGSPGEPGATVGHLFRKCPVPVMMLRDEPGPDVVTAVGPFDEEDRSMLDRTLIEMSSSLAAIRGGTLHVVHAWRLVGESLLRSNARRGMPAAMVDEMVRESHREAADEVSRLLELAQRAGVPVATHIEEGVAGEVIPAVVERLRAGVLVMGSLARTGVAGLLIGNTAERVLSSVSASVLAVKPPGFESPIAP